MTNPPPKHYPDGPYQPRFVTKAWGLDYNLGSVLKYVCRAGKKGPALDDLIKARDFLDFAIDDLANETIAKVEGSKWARGHRSWCSSEVYPGERCDCGKGGTPCK